MLLLVVPSCARAIRAYEGPERPAHEIATFKFKLGKLAPGHTAISVKISSIDGVSGDHYWGKSEKSMWQSQDGADAVWQVTPGYHRIVFYWQSSDQTGRGGYSSPTYRTTNYAVTRTGTLELAQDFKVGQSYTILVTAAKGPAPSEPYEVRLD